jgi:hypothetical protein
MKRNGPLRRTRLKPVNSKRRRANADPKYYGFIAQFPCIVCGVYGVQVAHVGAHGMGKKCPPRETLPICAVHHLWDYPESHHRLGKAFWTRWNLDRDALIRHYNELYERERAD